MPSLDLPPKPRLETLLRDAFSAMELKRLVSQVCPKLDSELGDPGPSKADFVHVVVESLERRKEVNGRFFRIVLRERPHLREEVMQLAAAFSVDKASILSSKSTAEPSSQRENSTDSRNIAQELEMRARRWLKGMLLPLGVSMSCASGAAYMLEHEDKQRTLQRLHSQVCRDADPLKDNKEDEHRAHENVALLQAQIAALQQEKQGYANALKQLERKMDRAVQGLMYAEGRLGHATAWRRYVHLQKSVKSVQSRKDRVDEKIVMVTRYQSVLIAGGEASGLDAKDLRTHSDEIAEDDESEDLAFNWIEHEEKFVSRTPSRANVPQRLVGPRRQLSPEELAREKTEHAKTHNSPQAHE